MKHKILVLIISLVMILTFTSCDVYTYATTQDDIYVEAEADIVNSDVSYNIIIKYGDPYYYNGRLLYYYYNNLYYYPFVYNDYLYLRTYRKPFRHLNYRPYFRPNRYDRRIENHYHIYRNKSIHHMGNTYRNRPHNINPDRPSIQNRPRHNSHQNRPMNNSRFGGKR